jgi:hypothetical protein
MLEFSAAVLFFVNILTFLLYAEDKRRAARKKQRISERALIFCTLAFGGFGALAGMYFAKHKTRKLKFRFAAAIGLLIVFVPAIHIAHGLTLGRIVRYLEIPFYSENLPSELNGYRVAFMADKHTISDEKMGKVVAKLNEKNLDLLILGGDFYMDFGHYQGTIRQLAKTITTDGIFGVEGNHDDYKQLFAAKRQHGITPLDNSGVHIREGFYLAGVRDLWLRAPAPNIEKAVADADANDFILLVTHNPDVTMSQRTDGIDLILAGHTHGGQIAFFGIPLYLYRGSITRYGARFSNGFAHSADGVPVFTTSGVGDYFDAPRIFARPEVVIFTMYSERTL